MSAERNPYDPSSIVPGPRLAIGSRSGDPLSMGAGVMAGTIRPDGTVVRSDSTPLVGANGELNADSKRALIQAQMILAQALNSGEVRQVNSTTHDNAKAKADRYQALVTAAKDPTNQQWQVLGEVLGDKIYETMGREGFARQIMQIKKLGPSETGRLTVHKKDVRAFYMLSNATAVASAPYASFVYPPEFNILAGCLIEEGEIERTGGEILDDKYNDLMEQTLKVEDEVLIRLARSASTSYNSAFTFSTFTPSIFSQMKTTLDAWGAQPSVALVAWNVMSDILADTEFSGYFDPVSKHNIVLSGSIGNFHGMKIMNDGYKIPTLRVLADGEVIFFGAPQILGGITERKPLTPAPVNRYAFMEAKRGWFFHQVEGMAVTNGRGIVRATKI